MDPTEFALCTKIKMLRFRKFYNVAVVAKLSVYSEIMN